MMFFEFKFKNQSICSQVEPSPFNYFVKQVAFDGLSMRLVLNLNTRVRVFLFKALY